MVGNALEQGRELLLLGLGEGGEQQTLMFARHVGNGRESLLSPIGQDEGVTAAVVGIGGALDEATGAQFIQKGDKAAGDHAQAAGEGLLGEPGRVGEDKQDSGMGGRQVELRETLREFAGGMTA